ncbi:MAG: thiamine pyrophosphate-binding protein [Lachnospiraceae bacterium]|nr:thiamine pyrophosphate-binding protein [Lachnospiraceae bacterium]
MRVSDYLADALYCAGVEDVFLVTGGGCMFLTDGLASHGKIRCVPCLHEQAASMAAIGYSQYRENYGACLVTTGCGGTNAVTGTLHAWQDHLPVIYISGQCNRNEMMCSVAAPVRAIGMQEADIVSIVKSITKYAVTVMDENDAVYHIEKAMYLAKAGCQGPVWLDIPLDVQEAEIDPGHVRHFDPGELQPAKTKPTADEVDYVVRALKKAERPVIVLGAGVRYAGAQDVFEAFVHKNQIPYVSTRRGWDICPKSDPLHIGLTDIRGNRAANFAVQNADMVLVLGSRLSLLTTGYNYDLFARGAEHVIAVDIDEDEHRKNTVRLDKVINADVKEFLGAVSGMEFPHRKEWANKCIHWKEIFPAILPEHMDDSRGISKFAFMDTLNRNLKKDSVVVTDAGATTEIPMQCLHYTDKRQRYVGSAEQCEMGYALPGAVGVSIARGKGEALCIVGDGSLQMNIQELQTCVTQKLPVKIFVWNNGGYATIYGHQKGIFKGRFVGVDEASGLMLPPLEKIACAYGLEYYRAEKLKELEEIVPKVMECPSPVLCDVVCLRDEVVSIAQVKAKYRLPDGGTVALPIEDMFPPIDRELFEQEMMIEPIRWWGK